MSAQHVDMPQSVSSVSLIRRPVRKEIDRIGGGNLAASNKPRYKH